MNVCAGIGEVNGLGRTADGPIGMIFEAFEELLNVLHNYQFHSAPARAHGRSALTVVAGHNPDHAPVRARRAQHRVMIACTARRDAPEVFQGLSNGAFAQRFPSEQVDEQLHHVLGVGTGIGHAGD